MNRQLIKKILPTLLIIILGVVLYGATLRGFAGNPTAREIKENWEQNAEPFELSPERGRFAHVMSLADNGSYALTKEQADFVYPDLGIYDGRFYSFFAPGMSYMAAPFYQLGREFGLSQVFTFAFVSVMAILCLIVLYRIARDVFQLPVWTSLSVVLVFAFATTSWSYAITLYQHLVTTFFILFSFYSVWKYSKAQTGSWVWGSLAWLCYGLSITIDYPNALLLLPVMVYFLIVSLKVSKVPDGVKVGFRWTIITTALVFALVTAWHFQHNAENFGSWNKLSGSITSYKAIVENSLENDPNAEEKALEAEGEKDVVGFFTEENMPLGFVTLTSSLDRGLLLFSPILLLGLIGIGMALRSHSSIEAGILITLIGMNLFLYSSWGDPQGGWAFGPRYIIPTMSILSLFVGVFLHNAGLAKRLIAFLLFIYSSAVALLGALTTNAIPPKSEAIPLNTGYNFLRNYEFLRADESAGYIFNTYFYHEQSLLAYGLVLYALLLVVTIIIMFVMPKYERHI